MAYWDFFDFVDTAGVNKIDEWLDGLSKAVRERLDDRLRIMEQMQRLGEPQVKKRQVALELFEIVYKVERVQWRPLVCYGPRRGQVTILAGASERNDRLRPPGIENTALARLSLIQNQGRVTRHVYDK